MAASDIRSEICWLVLALNDFVFSHKDVIIFFFLLKVGSLWDNFLDNFLFSFRLGLIFVAFALPFGLFKDFLGLLLLFVILSFLQTNEIFTINFIELLQNIVGDLLDTRNEDELKRIDTPVGHLEGLVQGLELSLQSGNRDQDLEELCEFIPGLLDRLSSH